MLNETKKKSVLLAYLEYQLFCFLIMCVYLFPRLDKFFARFLAYLFQRIPSLKITVSNNLDLAFTNTKSTKYKQQLQQQFFQHLGLLLVETVQLFHYINRKQQQQKLPIIWDTASLQRFHECVQEKNGLICISAHYGNWEWLAFAMARLGYPLNLLYRPLDNTMLDSYLCCLRKQYPANLIPKDRAYPDALKVLRKKEVLALLIDQNQAKKGVFVSFFNRQASSSKGAAILAYGSQAPVLCIYTCRNLLYQHEIFCYRIHLNRQLPLDSFIQDSVQIMTSHIESIIRKQPEQWLWAHSRWKNQPI